jgi:glutaredoxin
MLFVYSKDDCTWCESLKSRLDMQGIEFIEMRIGKDLSREEFLTRFPGVKTVPYVLNKPEINEKEIPIGGYNDTIKWLDNQKQ